MPRLPRVSGREAVFVFERSEQHHRQSVDAVSALGASLITCEAASRRTKGRALHKASTRHQEVKANLFDVLRHQVKERSLGKLFDAPAGCILAEATIVQPHRR